MAGKRKISIMPRSDCTDNYFNYNLRRAREFVDCSHLEIAREIGASNSAICNYERLRSFPSRRKAKKIINFLNKKLEEKLKELEVNIKAKLVVEDIFPEKLREITDKVKEERKEEKKWLDFESRIEYVGSNSEEIERKLRREPGILLEEDFLSPVINDELKKRIEYVLQTLTYNEREVIKLRYGLGDKRYIRWHTYTLEECSRIFRLTRERVRQIEAKAIRKLQHPVRAKHLQDFVY